MVAQQVLRKAVAAAALVALAAGPARAGKPAEDQAIAVIDLGRGTDAERATRRAELVQGIAGVQGLRNLDDPELRGALAGEQPDRRAEVGRKALAEAARAFGALDCTRAVHGGETAVLELAAAQASGAAVGGDLVQAYVYQLLCADQVGDSGAAQYAARQLRALGAPEPPPGVTAAVWNKVPALDATVGLPLWQVDVAVAGGGAGVVWIDHAAAGTAPLTTQLAEGRHLVAVAREGAATAVAVVAARGGSKAEVALPAAAGGRWRAIAARVRGWRSGAAKSSAAGLGALMTSARVRYAVVMNDRLQLEVWQAGRARAPARHLGNAADAIEVGALVQDAERQRRQPGIDPDVPLLRESADDRGTASSDGPSNQEWWVYAAIVGAIVIGAGIVAANELGDDTQRIEITLP
jgi:hypothetical protein